jgi:hypothetical protein
MKRLLFLILLSTPAWGVSPMTFEWKPGATVPPHVVRVMVTEAAKISRYERPRKLPIAKVISNTEMQKLACAGEDCVVFGAFLFAEPNTIYLNADLEPWRRSVTMIHELVHVLQFREYGGARTCLEDGAAEMEAHAAAFRYMTKNRIRGSMMPPQFFCIAGINQ